MYLTPAPETAVYCIPATVRRKGPRFPGNVCPERKIRTKKAEAEAEEEEEEGRRQPPWEPGRRRPSYRKLDRSENGRLSTPGWQLMSPEAQGWRPCLAVASVYLIQSMVTDGGPSRGCTQRTKPVYLLWFIFTCLKTPGKRDDSGVTSCHYILLLKIRKMYFPVTPWSHTLERKGGGTNVETQKDDNL